MFSSYQSGCECRARERIEGARTDRSMTRTACCRCAPCCLRRRNGLEHDLEVVARANVALEVDVVRTSPARDFAVGRADCSAGVEARSTDETMQAISNAPTSALRARRSPARVVGQNRRARLERKATPVSRASPLRRSKNRLTCWPAQPARIVNVGDQPAPRWLQSSAPARVRRPAKVSPLSPQLAPRGPGKLR